MRCFFRILVVSALIFAMLGSIAFADIVYLKNGKKIKGKITEKTDAFVTIETEDEWHKIDLEDVEKIVIEKEEPEIEVITKKTQGQYTSDSSCCIAGLAGVGALFIALIVLAALSN
jgi:murein L,D-transpeptidase YafK